MAAPGKGFGCRPRRERRPRYEGRRTKATEERTRGKAVRTWLSMGIWRWSRFGGGWFSQNRRELEAADDRGLSAAATLGDLIEAGLVML